jgi:hypothetical protein
LQADNLNGEMIYELDFVLFFFFSFSFLRGKNRGPAIGCAVFPVDRIFSGKGGEEGREGWSCILFRNAKDKRISYKRMAVRFRMQFRRVIFGQVVFRVKDMYEMIEARIYYVILDDSSHGFASNEIYKNIRLQRCF